MQWCNQRDVGKPCQAHLVTILEKNSYISLYSCFGLLWHKAMKQVLSFSVPRYALLLWQGSFPQHTIFELLQIREIRLINGLFILSILNI